MDLKAYRVVVEGRVTGVGFRYATVREASRYADLRGYVRNVTSRQVECVVQGRSEDVNAMVSWLRHGPSSARVTDVRVEPLQVDPARDVFRVSF